MSKWPMAPLSQVATPITRPIQVEAGKPYRTIGVKWWGEGAYERQTIDGSETAAASLSLVCEDDLIINKIWVRHGSTAIATKAVDGCAASNEFPTFKLDRDQVCPRWVHWLTKTRWFWGRCDALSMGTSGKNRIKPEKFLTISIPLPPLAEQRRLVERIDTLAAKIEEAKRLRVAAQVEAIALMNAARRRLIGGEPQANWVPLSSIVEQIENGWSPACEARQVTNGEWGVLKVGAVSFGIYDPKENKALPLGLAPRAEYEVRFGDFIMSRANTYELVGACVVVEQTPTRLMLSDKLFRFIFRKNAEVDTTYLDHVLKSPALRDQIVRGASGTSPTMKNISKEKVLALLIPGHKPAVQKDIAARLNGIRQQVGAATTIQAVSSKELDAMLPATLDRAFRGEL